MRPLKQWARVGGVKLLGACAGPPHLSDEPLQTVAPLNLRCRSRAEMLTDEFEEESNSTGSSPPTAKPKQNSKCPANCDCDVSANHNVLRPSAQRNPVRVQVNHLRSLLFLCSIHLCQIESQHATCEGQGHTKVPRGFPAKTQLLDLRSNHFHYLPANSFPGSSQVVSLHLDLCKIHEIESGAFRGMKKLFYLYLSDNDLTSLDPGAFAGAPELTYLYLEGNRLAQFPGSGQWFVKSSLAVCQFNLQEFTW